MRQDLGSNDSEQFKKIYMSRHENVRYFYTKLVNLFGSTGVIHYIFKSSAKSQHPAQVVLLVLILMWKGVTFVVLRDQPIWRAIWLLNLT